MPPLTQPAPAALRQIKHRVISECGTEARAQAKRRWTQKCPGGRRADRPQAWRSPARPTSRLAVLKNPRGGLKNLSGRPELNSRADRSLTSPREWYGRL